MLWLSTQVQAPEGFLFSQVATATYTASFSLKTWQALACMHAGLLGEGGGRRHHSAIQSTVAPKTKKSNAVRQFKVEVCPSLLCMHTRLLCVGREAKAMPSGKSIQRCAQASLACIQACCRFLFVPAAGCSEPPQSFSAQNAPDQHPHQQTQTQHTVDLQGKHPQRHSLTHADDPICATP